MIRIAVVDDEEIFRDQIKGYMRRYMDERRIQIVVDYLADGSDLVENYNGKYDVILLDIQMKFMDGMTAAERIRRQDPKVVIMFVTNRQDYAIRGYTVNALDYVVKPIEYFAFSQKIDKALEGIRSNEQHYVVISHEGGVRKLNADHITYIESRGHQLIFHTKEQTYETRGVMQEMEAELLERGFFRINKGYLVNMRHVDAVRDGCCEIGSEQLVISRRNRKDFMQALVEYMGEVIR